MVGVYSKLHPPKFGHRFCDNVLRLWNIMYWIMKGGLVEGAETARPVVAAL